MLLSSQFRLSAVCNASASQLPTVNNELPDRPRASIIGRNTSTRRFVGDSRASLFAKWKRRGCLASTRVVQCSSVRPVTAVAYSTVQQSD